jgi:hypothetical protein
MRPRLARCALSACVARRAGVLRNGTGGWTYAPMPGCHVPAKVTEEYDLSGGRVERIIGQVTAPHHASLSHVVDSTAGIGLRQGVDAGRWSFRCSLLD